MSGYRANGKHANIAKKYLLPMIRFHNKVKECVYREITKNAGDEFITIEIGAGYLNDLNRMIAAGITKVYAIEPDKKSIEKGNILLQKAGDKTPIIHWINSTLQDLYETQTMPNVKANAVLSMFSGGYLFSDSNSYEQFADFVAKHTMYEGYFAIVYYDSNPVRDFFKEREGKQLLYKKGSTILLRVSLESDAVRVLIGSIGKEYIEKLIDYDLLNRCLVRRGFDLYERIPFKTFRTGILKWEYDNSLLENYSDLHVAIIYKKCRG